MCVPSVAVVDCGSNSTRLLVVSGAGSTLRREMRITRLAAGVDSSGRLTREACDRTYATLSLYRGWMDELDVGRGLLVATSAVRDAVNGQDFLSRAGEIAGIHARLLSGDEEAAFSYAGATRGLADDARPTLVVDIGGGSTELAASVDGSLRGYSMQLGCVRVSERALGSGVVTPGAAAAATEMISTELDRAFNAVPAFSQLVGRVRLVGLAGTVATLAQLVSGVSVYDRAAVHHRLVKRAEVLEWRERLGALSPAQRLELPGMVAGREDVLAAGVYILEAVMDRFGARDVLSSEDDILDGVAASLV